MQDIPLEVVHEDRHLIVLNKAAGMVVHPAPGNYSGTMVNALLHRLCMPAVRLEMPPSPEESGFDDSGTCSPLLPCRMPLQLWVCLRPHLLLSSTWQLCRILLALMSAV